MIRLSPGVPVVDVERSGVVESVHHGHALVLAADGTVVASVGAVDEPVFPRSSLKPVQAAAMARSGLVLPSTGQALAAASHSGTEAHVAVVRETLASAGLDEDALQCPPDWPLSQEARDALLSLGRTRIRMNCSGKHSAMLATCQLLDWPTDTYLSPEHPLQQAILQTVQDLTAETVPATGVDGCGAPLFAVSLHGLARAIARIAVDVDGPVAPAMRAHPELVAGEERSPTKLMRGIPGLIAKDGAEGVYVAALPDGAVVAVKIDDGAQRAAEQVVVAGLRALGVQAAVLDELADAVVLGGGRPVGRITARPLTA